MERREEPIKYKTSVYTDIFHLLFAKFLLQWALLRLSALKIIEKIKSALNIFFFLFLLFLLSIIDF